MRRRVLGGLANIFTGLAAVAEAMSQGDKEPVHHVTASTLSDPLHGAPITLLREHLWYLLECGNSEIIDRFLDEHGERMQANGGIFACAPPSEGFLGARRDPPAAGTSGPFQ